jgi:hypothetical protein
MSWHNQVIGEQAARTARPAVLRSGPGALVRQFGHERRTEGDSQSIDLR